MRETKIPGKKAKHAIITNECRDGEKGPLGAFEEGMIRLQDEYMEIVAGREGTRYNAHLVLVIEPLGE